MSVESYLSGYDGGQPTDLGENNIEHHRWIPVGERLPEKKCTAVVFCGRDIFIGCRSRELHPGHPEFQNVPMKSHFSGQNGDLQ